MLQSHLLVASTISQKLDANVFIYGSIKQAGNKLRINAKLIDAKTEEVLKPFEIDGSNSEEMIFPIIDSLRKKVTDFLIISNLIKELNPEFQQWTATTDSPEAYRYYIDGQNAFNSSDYPTAINWLSQAIEIDSTFTYANILLSESLFKNGKIGEA